MQRACLRFATVPDDNRLNAVRQVLVPVEPIDDKFIVLAREFLAFEELAKIMRLPWTPITPEVARLGRVRWVAKFVVFTTHGAAGDAMLG